MKTINQLSINSIKSAAETLAEVSAVTPLENNERLSSKYEANIYLKREDLQLVRSYKIRGAFNKINKLGKDDRLKGVVCASAGNHAQGVAYSCNKLHIEGVIFMPETTPKQKIESVKRFGGAYVRIKLIGDTFDDCYQYAKNFQREKDKVFVHPFNDLDIVEGQATVSLEVIQQLDDHIDYLIIPIGGGGLAAGAVSVLKECSPKTKIIGVEPFGAPSMTMAMYENEPTELVKIEKFVDGAAVKKVGEITYDICKNNIDKVLLADEGSICDKILEMYNYDAIVAEPAGVMSVVALGLIKDDIVGKNVVCIISGGNNDIGRMEEIKERAAVYLGEKHYFLIDFPQRSGALKNFILKVLGDQDDIIHFEYVKKNYRTFGTAVIGIEVEQKGDFIDLRERMKQMGYFREYINDNQQLMNILI
jgi:threonine dehydratase